MIIIIIILFFLSFTNENAQNKNSYHAVITNPHRSYVIKRDGLTIQENKLLIGDTVFVFGNFDTRLNISCDPFVEIDTIKANKMLIVPKRGEDESFMTTIKKFWNFLANSDHSIYKDSVVKAEDIESINAQKAISENVSMESVPVIVRGAKNSELGQLNTKLAIRPNLITMLPNYKVDFSLFNINNKKLTFLNGEQIIFTKNIEEHPLLDLKEVEDHFVNEVNSVFLVILDDSSKEKVEINLIGQNSLSMIERIFSGIDDSKLSDVEKILYKSAYLQIASDRMGDSLDLYWLSYQIVVHNNKLLSSKHQVVKNLIERYKYVHMD